MGIKKVLNGPKKEEKFLPLCTHLCPFLYPDFLEPIVWFCSFRAMAELIAALGLAFDPPAAASHPLCAGKLWQAFHRQLSFL